MNLNPGVRNAVAFLLFTSLILFDQFSKYTIRVRGGFYICNKGIAFGLPFFETILAIMGIFLILAVFNFKFKIFNLKLISNFNPLDAFGITLIISGALSNIADRLYFGCVIDFIDLKFWPVFNLADIYITIGGAVIIITMIKKQ